MVETTGRTTARDQQLVCLLPTRTFPRHPWQAAPCASELCCPTPYPACLFFCLEVPLLARLHGPHLDQGCFSREDGPFSDIHTRTPSLSLSPFLCPPKGPLIRPLIGYISIEAQSTTYGQHTHAHTHTPLRHPTQEPTRQTGENGKTKVAPWAVERGNQAIWQNMQETQNTHNTQAEAIYSTSPGPSIVCIVYIVYIVYSTAGTLLCTPSPRPRRWAAFPGLRVVCSVYFGIFGGGGPCRGCLPARQGNTSLHGKYREAASSARSRGLCWPWPTSTARPLQDVAPDRQGSASNLRRQSTRQHRQSMPNRRLDWVQDTVEFT